MVRADAIIPPCRSTVSLTVADRERSARFYAEHFGLTERLHDDEHLFIPGGPRLGACALGR